MMEIYIHAGCMDEAEAIFSQLRNPPPDVTKYTILINGYGIHNQPGRAMNLLYKVLQQEQQSLPSTSGWNASSVTHRSYQNRPVPLNVIVLTAVMNAWRKAGRLDQAWTVFRLMTEHPVCRQVWKIRPNQVTYETLLQCCLASIVSSTQNQIDVDGDDPTGSNENSVGQHAERVMDDMEQRYRAGEIACQPTKRLYRLAIHICERVGDWDRAAELSASMKAIAQSARSKQDDGPHASQTIVESL
jgi:pentatricopeptide repeat protein